MARAPEVVRRGQIDPGARRGFVSGCGMSADPDTAYLACAKELARVRARLDHAHDMIARLQVALDFWIPACPAECDDDIRDRLYNDLCLLMPWYADEPWNPAGAEKLGWVKLCADSSSESRP